MYAENNSSSDILKRMKEDITNDVNKNEGSFVHDVLSPTSIESSERYKKLDDILKKAIPQLSSEKWLRMHAESRGVTEKECYYSTTNETIIGVKGTVIPKDIIVQTLGGLKYLTTQETIIQEDGKAVVPIRATKVGSKYNVSANTITQLPVQISGVISVTNEKTSEGGTDPETDEELLKRFLERVQNPPSSGNKNDYIRWAKEVPGVKGVKVIPLWAGGGTVKIICYGGNGQPLDNTILNSVKEYIDPKNGTGEGKAPIGANVTITTVINKLINVKVIGLKSSKMDLAKRNIEYSISNYINKIQPGQTIKNINVAAVIATTENVDDFASIMLNNTTGNIITTDEEKPILGAITYE